VESKSVTLLDSSNTGRRLLQQGLALAGAVLSVSGFVVAASRVLVCWDVRYQGHVIRFENNVVFGERRYIDGERITQGALGYRKVIEGTIKSGTGTRDQIRAASVAGVIRFRCKLTVESS